MIPAGGHILDCVHAFRDRVKLIFAETAPEYVALRSPLSDEANPDLEVRIPSILSGFPNLADRATPILPFVAVRPPSARSARVGTEVQRTSPLAAVIGVHCDEVSDYEYAWAIVERIWRPLTENPYLSDGLYVIDWENIEVAEIAELSESWQAYFLQMTVPVFLPAYVQTEGVNGEKVVWEAQYGEPYIGYAPEH